MAKLAYVRVSSERQNTARQKKALKAAGCKVFYEEKVSGATMERPELKRLLNEMQEGDIVYVHEISRLSRSTRRTAAKIASKASVRIDSLRKPPLFISP